MQSNTNILVNTVHTASLACGEAMDSEAMDSEAMDSEAMDAKMPFDFNDGAPVLAHGAHQSPGVVQRKPFGDVTSRFAEYYADVKSPPPSHGKSRLGAASPTGARGPGSAVKRLWSTELPPLPRPGGVAAGGSRALAALGQSTATQDGAAHSPTRHVPTSRHLVLGHADEADGAQHPDPHAAPAALPALPPLPFPLGTRPLGAASIFQPPVLQTRGSGGGSTASSAGSNSCCLPPGPGAAQPQPPVSRQGSVSLPAAAMLPGHGPSPSGQDAGPAPGLPFPLPSQLPQHDGPMDEGAEEECANDENAGVPEPAPGALYGGVLGSRAGSVGAGQVVPEGGAPAGYGFAALGRAGSPTRVSSPSRQMRLGF